MKLLIKSFVRKSYGWGRRVPCILNRGEFPFILNKRGLLGEGVEVGVKHGGYSEYLLQHWGGRRLISVDAWKAFPEDEYRDEANVSQHEFDVIYANTCKRLSVFGERSQIMRCLSVEAAGQLPDASMDFVYLDARRDYDGVVEDLNAWFPKVRRGGVLAGHDYLDGQVAGTEFGVKRAVDEFAAKYKLLVQNTFREPTYKSWFIFL
jgi:hypothetical protein